MQKITVVSLGPGSRAHITLGVMETMEKARKLILRTEKMDAAKYLREKGIAYESLDQLHEDCEDFEEFTQQAAECVAKVAKRANVVYAVMDAAADATVEELSSVRGIGEQVLFIHNGRAEWTGTGDTIDQTDSPHLREFLDHA